MDDKSIFLPIEQIKYNHIIVCVAPSYSKISTKHIIIPQIARLGLQNWAQLDKRLDSQTIMLLTCT